MELIKEMKDYAKMHNVPIMQDEGIDFLINTIKEKKAESLLEIGSAIGYSSIRMNQALPSLKIETIERNDTNYNEAVKNIKKSSLDIKIYHDDALLFDESLLQNAPYDVIFIDAAKAQYRKFFEKYIPYLKEDGIVIVDNLDFHGMIDHIDDINNRNTRALVRKIDRFRRWIFNHKDYDVEYHHIGDGVCIIKKKKHELELAMHITSLDYLYEFISMNIKTYIIAGDYSAYSKNTFSLKEIEEVSLKVDHLYVMVNGLYDEHEMSKVKAFIDKLNDLDIKGLLFQDFGVLHYVKKQRYLFDMMYAPMTLNTNSMTLNVLEEMGVNSAFIAKEIPLEEQIAIKDKTHLPLMIQGHGVQYMMSSKRLLLSSYEEVLHKSFNKENVLLHARESDYASHIYEDERGTTIYSENKLYTLDLFDSLSAFDYLYIETNFMDPLEQVEVAHMYSECLNAYNNEGLDVYVHHVKEFMPLLKKVSTPIDRGFINDSTLYKLDDVKRRDNNG